MQHQGIVHLIVPGVVLLGQLAGVRAAPGGGREGGREGGKVGEYSLFPA